MTEDEVQALPVVVDLPTAARVLGLRRITAYELVRSGAWPTPVLRFGRLIKVRRSSLLELLDIPVSLACPSGEKPDSITWPLSAPA